MAIRREISLPFIAVKPDIEVLRLAVRQKKLVRTQHLRHPNAVYWLAFCATLGGLVFGYGTGIINGAIVLIESDKQFELSDRWKETVVGSTLFATAIMSIITGRLADCIGRKSTIVLAGVVFACGSLVMAAALNVYVLLVGRLLVCSALGMVSCSVPVYVAECSPQKIRGFLVSFNQVFIAFGLLLASTMAAILQHFQNGWRIMLGAGAVPSLAHLLFFFNMPESPRFMMMKGHNLRARETLRRLRSPSWNIEKEIREIEASLAYQKEKIGIHKIFSTICSNTYVKRALFVGCMLQIFQQLSGINAVIFYSATILRNAGFSPTSAIWLSVIPFMLNLLATFPALIAVERLGRKLILAVSFLACAASCGVLTAGFVLSSKDQPQADSKNDPLGSYGQCANYRQCEPCLKLSNKKCGYCVLAEPDMRREGACVHLNPFEAPPIGNHYYATNGRCAKNNSFHREFVLLNEHCPSDYAWIPLLGLNLFMISYSPGVGPIPWTVNAEIYPVLYRSMANSIATFINWTFNGIVTMTFVTMTNTIKAHGTFLFYTVTSLTASIFVMLLVPETKGLSLEEVEFLFMGKKQYSRYSRIRESFGLLKDNAKSPGSSHKPERRSSSPVDKFGHYPRKGSRSSAQPKR